MSRAKAWRGAVVALVVVAGACGGPRNALGTSATPCYRALPAAQGAVHERGKLVGVRRIHTTTLRKRFPANPRVTAATDKFVCTFAFKGDYKPGDVALADNKVPGPFAVVVVGSKSNQLLAAFVVQQLPTRFRHSH